VSLASCDKKSASPLHCQVSPSGIVYSADWIGTFFPIEFLAAFHVRRHEPQCDGIYIDTHVYVTRAIDRDEIIMPAGDVVP
jgi:hypothetical protein